MNAGNMIVENKKKSEFAGLHPAVNFVYIVCVMLITMITLNPYMLALSLIMSAVYGCMAEGIGYIKKNIVIEIMVIVFTVMIQPLFSRSGTTALFYINDNAVTLESYIYGFVISILLISVLQWSSCASIMFTSEKFMYLFGRIIPSLGLIFSMILRFVPLFRERYRQINEAQQGMGRGMEKIGLFQRARQFIKELSILISWSLESSIETSMSMEARGYGLKGRTSYSRYLLKKSDIAMIGYIFIMTAVVITGIMTGYVDMFYLPRIYMADRTIFFYMTIAAYAVVGCTPIVYDIHYKNKKLFL